MTSECHGCGYSEVDGNEWCICSTIPPSMRGHIEGLVSDRRRARERCEFLENEIEDYRDEVGQLSRALEGKA